MNTTYCPEEPGFDNDLLTNLGILGIYFCLFIYVNNFKFCVPEYEKATIKTLLLEFKCLFHPYMIMFIDILLLYDLKNFIEKANII